MSEPKNSQKRKPASVAYYEVSLDDRGLDWDQSELLFIRAESWARNHCASFVQAIHNDMSDVSLVMDTLVVFEFTDEKDATLFHLKWK